MWSVCVVSCGGFTLGSVTKGWGGRVTEYRTHETRPTKGRTFRKEKGNGETGEVTR